MIAAEIDLAASTVWKHKKYGLSKPPSIREDNSLKNETNMKETVGLKVICSKASKASCGHLNNKFKFFKYEHPLGFSLF